MVQAPEELILRQISRAEKADETGGAFVESAPGAWDVELGKGAGGVGLGDAAHVGVAKGHGMGADEQSGQLVEARVVSDQEDAADGFRHVLQSFKEGWGGGQVEAVERVDEGGLVPGLQRLDRLQGTPGGADEHEVWREAEAGHGGAHSTGSLAAAVVKRPRMIGQVAVVPRGLRVPKEEKLPHNWRLPARGAGRKLRWRCVGGLRSAVQVGKCWGCRGVVIVSVRKGGRGTVCNGG